MPKKRKLSNVKDRCRICLVEQGCMTNLFEQSVFAKIKNLILSTSIEIENDTSLPEIICHVCLYKLEIWDEFKNQFIRSHRLLTNQLGIISPTNDTLRTDSAKRLLSDTQDNTSQDSVSDKSAKKKIKAEMSSLVSVGSTTVNCGGADSKSIEICLSEDDPGTSKESTQKTNEDSNDEQTEELVHKKEDVIETKPSLVPMKIKNLSGKRGKTIERRRASTKRWVARKKALLAATGKSASDTDSIGSDEAQLSAIQKARVRNIVDKENPRHKRVARELKLLGATLSEKYITKHESDNFGYADSDSDTRKTRSQKESSPTTSLLERKTKVKMDKKSKEIKENISSVAAVYDKENMAVPSEHCTQNERKEETEVHLNDNTLTPHLVRSELELGNATYVITSRLILSEPQYLSETNLVNLTKELRNYASDQNSQEKNTDIIDAVQLRRINPISSSSNEKKTCERCLNIEIEGTELEALKCVQDELARFIEKEIKQRLCGMNIRNAQNSILKRTPKYNYQTLDQQLKGIVEKAIKKNFESSTVRCSENEFDAAYELPRTVSPKFAHAAEKSKKYQPQVIVERLNVTNQSKHCKINNAHITNDCVAKTKTDTSISEVSEKHQGILPIKYSDCNTSTLESDESNISPEVIECEASKLIPVRNVQICKVNIQKPPQQTTTTTLTKKSVESVQSPVTKNGQEKESAGTSVKINPIVQEIHDCGICGKTFNTREDFTKHSQIHKTDNLSARHSKHKVMRCKRCHEIVEARFVKAHVCKQIHKCYVCNSTFRTEKLLIRHLDSHDQSEFNIENITKGSHKKPETATDAAKLDPPTGSNKIEHNSNHFDSNRLSKNEIGKVPHTKNSKVDSLNDTDKPRETYTCFVCDKIFTDEEEMKDHLQKHCDDVSESEQSKEQYECAICGDSMNSEDALEAHVEKHLFDEEDDNPNLINIGNENDKPNMNGYQCLQCAETFNSEMLLEMHMQAHEEEAAIAEWERQGTKSNDFQCMICDELFDTEEDLSEHLDIHNGNAHACQLCEKPFATLEDLQKHVATH